MFCAKCGKPIADDSKFCVHCGAKVAIEVATPAPQAEVKTELPKIIPVVSPTVQMPNQESKAKAEVKPEVTTAQTMLEPIVEKHCDYYLPEFEKVEKGKKGKFKWAAFLFGPMFCFYRKCGELFKKYFLLPYIVLGIGLICFVIAALTFSKGVLIAAGILSVVYSIWLLVSSIRFGKNFNREYYEHCKKELNTSAPKCGVSVGAGIGVAAIFAALFSIIMAVALITGILDGNPEIDGFDYDAYYEDFYEEFGDGSEEYTDYGEDGSSYALESTYQPLMVDSVTYNRDGVTDPEAPFLVIGQIDGEEYGIFYTWSNEAGMPVVALEGQSEWAGNGYFQLHDSSSGGYLEYCLSGDESRCVIDVTQYGDVGSLGEDYSGEYMDVNGYMEYYYG